jgi:hypothetical protein
METHHRRAADRSGVSTPLVTQAQEKFFPEKKDELIFSSTSTILLKLKLILKLLTDIYVTRSLLGEAPAISRRRHISNRNTVLSRLTLMNAEKPFHDKSRMQCLFRYQS